MHCRKLATLVSGIAVFGFCLTMANARTLQPLDVEDANTLPQGQVDLRLQINYLSDFKPAFSNGIDHGKLYELPKIGANIGVSERVEIQIEWELLKIDSNLHDDYGPGDPRLATKINIFKEDGNMPAIGVKFGVKIPSADDKKGLGTNNADFFASGLFSKGFGCVTAHLNIGVAIDGNPNSNTGQDDLVTYGVGLEVPVIEKLVVLGDIDGQAASKYNNDQARARIGLQYNIEDFTIDAAISKGLNNNTEDYKAGVGLVYHWKAF
jgi:hypothetical protein